MKLPLISRALSVIGKAIGSLSPVDSRGGWWPIVRESYAGAWQQNVTIVADEVMESPALFSCITLIAGDIAKLRIKLVELQSWGGWTPVDSPAFSPVLRKPNRYQNHIQFKEHWMLSKLTRGNTYALKERDNRGLVVRLYILDPTRVQPLVAEDGSVYYKLCVDNLTGLREDITVPASEIIHDRFNCFFHPLVGLSPIYASGLPALQSLRIGRHWSKFFGNNAQPGGVLTAPGAISQITADRIKATWETNYTGINAGRVAVLGDGLKYEPLSPTAVDSQVIQQLQWSAETIASTLHVPAYKINVGPMPTSNNVEELGQQYYAQCLQKLIEDFELCMDEGLGLDAPKEGRQLGTELDLTGLLRMDTASKVKAAADALAAGFMSPNEARAQFDLPPVKGGETPYLQQQNWTLQQLAEREPPKDAPAIGAPAATPAMPPMPEEDMKPDDEEDKSIAAEWLEIAAFTEMQKALKKISQTAGSTT